MLDSLVALTDLSSHNLPDGYKLVPKVSPDWKSSERRLLIVIETVDTADLKARELCSPFNFDKQTGNCGTYLLNNILRLARTNVRRYPDVDKADTEFALGVCNWNAAKNKHLDRPEVFHKPFTDRVRALIKKLKPTHVLIFGDLAASCLLSHIDNIKAKRGWVHSHEGVLYTNTLDLEPLYSTYNSRDDDDEDEGDDERPGGQDDKGGNGDLTYYVIRHVMNALAGRHLHDLSWVKPNAVYIDTVEKFDWMFDKLMAADRIAFDSETENLSSHNNKFYYHQFAVNAKRAFVLPLYHPKTPFTGEELQYIYGKLRKFFASKKRKTLITQNGSFDLRVVRPALDIPFIRHHLHEITAAEALLDENVGALPKRVFSGRKLDSIENLKWNFAQYNNDWYFTAPFSKDERINIGQYEPDHPDVLAYCAMDCCSIYAMADAQLARADAIRIVSPVSGKAESYRPYFERHLRGTMGREVVCLSHLGQNGSTVDVPYMMSLLGPNSQLKKVLEDIESKAKLNELVQKANAIVSKSAGNTSKGLFAGKQPWLFQFSKPEHRKTLFFRVMGLEAVSKTKKGDDAIDKHFIAEYKDAYDEVALYGEFQKASKLLGTYVRGWIKKLRSNMDSIRDSRFRAGYGFFRVVTGRLGSFGPNLQQIPSRGDMAKVIKRMFIAPENKLSVRFDYSAHEVRVWAIVAGDNVLAESFKAGYELRRQLVAAKPADRPAIVIELKKKGDLHLQNVKRFFGVWVDKEHPLRDAVKSVIFGLIYGKGAKALARDVYLNALNGLKAKVSKALSAVNKAAEANDKTTLVKVNEEYAALKKELKKKENEEPDVDQADEIMAKLFQEFNAGGVYLENKADEVKKNGFVTSLIGRRRVLYRVFTGKKSFIAAAVRCAKNAPIQGFASEIGMMAEYLTMEACADFLQEQKAAFGIQKVAELFPDYSRAVHDAQYHEVDYRFFIPFLWISQYQATYGVARKIEEEFGVKFPVDPEIELEISASEDKAYKWDWTLANLREIIIKTIDDQHVLGRCKDPQGAKDLVFGVDQSVLDAVQAQYPLLNVKRIDWRELLEAPAKVKEAA